MNTREKLIESLKKDMWFIDSYYDRNRIFSLIRLLEYMDRDIARDVDHIKLSKNIRYIYSYDEDHIVSGAYTLSNELYKDITQVFNEYLEEHEPHVWLHSVLSAMQLGLNVDWENEDKWLPVSGSNLFTECKYRIEHMYHED